MARRTRSGCRRSTRWARAVERHWSATPLSQPATPDGLTAAVAPVPSLGSGQVKLTWTAPSNNGSAITDYLIERSVDGTSWTAVDEQPGPPRRRRLR